MADLAVPVVVGNADQAMLDLPEWWHDPAAVGAPEWSLPVFEIGVWCKAQLNTSHLDYLASLPETVGVDIDGTSMLAFHGSPRSTTEGTTTETSDDEIGRMIEGFPQRVLVGGHTHVPMVREVGAQILVNPGSVGAPFERPGFAGEVRILDHAAYAVLDVTPHGIEPELVQVRLDGAALEDEARSSGMPSVDWWLAQRM